MFGFIEDYYNIRIKNKKPHWINSEWGLRQMEPYWEEQDRVRREKLETAKNSMPYGEWISLKDYQPIDSDKLRIRYSGRDWVSTVTATNFHASLKDQTIYFEVNWSIFGALCLSNQSDGMVMRFKTWEEAKNSFEHIPDETTEEAKEKLSRQSKDAWKAISS